MKKYFKKLRHIVHNWREYRKQGYCGNVKIGSKWGGYIPSYISNRLQLETTKGDTVVVTCYTAPELVSLLCYWYKHVLFWTAENTHVQDSAWRKFEDIHRLNKRIDLAIGFDYLDSEPNYVRFPFWLCRMFGVKTTYEDVVKFVEKYNYSSGEGRDRFCSMICKADYFDERAIMADLIEQIAPISYPSGFRHNDDSLKGEFEDKKEVYLSHFKFNLCPENTNNRGYVTEKVFDAIVAGCIPIYWGNEGMPEPDILNPNAIIYLDMNHPEPALKKIKLLVNSEEEYRKFIAQPRFLPGAADAIWGYFTRLDKKLETILKD